MLLIRADASTQIGTGHVMRCLALAQAWQEAGGQAALAAMALPPALAERVVAEGLSVHALATEPGSPDDARQLIALAYATGAVWVVVDGYQFGADYQRALKEAGLKLLFVDDYGHAASYCADLVLNQNSYAHEGLYAERAPHTRLLLGARYVLLRREFWPWRGRQPAIAPVAGRILITLGGSDPDHVTLKVIQALDLIADPALEAVVVAGGGNPRFDELVVAARGSRHQIRVERNVADMPALMVWADLAVSAAGSTCYELACMGLPALLLVLADNQAPVAAALDAAGAGRSLGWHNRLVADDLVGALGKLIADASARAAMSAVGKALIDGYGSARVAAMLRGTPLRLRRAEPDDCPLIWEWANDPVVRGASFNSAPIPWNQHVAWFTGQLDGRSALFFVAEDASGQPQGQVRFTVEANAAVISVSLGPLSRGLGYGRELIRLGCAAAFAKTAVDQIDAYVKPDNEASLRAFERAGFARVETLNELQALHLVLRREEVPHE